MLRKTWENEGLVNLWEKSNLAAAEVHWLNQIDAVVIENNNFIKYQVIVESIFHTQIPICKKMRKQLN